MARRNTKAVMVFSAVKLLSERGVHGLTIDAVLADSQTPRGSVYHHFPGGRNQLLLEAAQAASAQISGAMKEAITSADVAGTLDRFVAFWRDYLERTEFRAGCPIVALLAGDDVPKEVFEVAQTCFVGLIADLARAVQASGVGAAEAERIAATAISAIEGAIALCRALRSSAPLDLVAEQLRGTLEVDSWIWPDQ